jgi:hypothetical protein
MKKLAFGGLCLYILFICGCEKNGCQTFLQGAWIAKYPVDSAQLAIDSVFFYNGDSLIEKYKYRYPGDTNYQTVHTTYYINDDCNEMDFNGTNTWTQLSTTPRFNILLITPFNLLIRSQASAGSCDTCTVYFTR